MAFMINSHVYLMTAQNLPKRFYQTPLERFFHGLAEGINFYNRYDKANWLARRINRGYYENQREILDEFIAFYSDEPEMRFMVHSIDFDYTPVEDPLISYRTQLQELILLKSIYQEKIYPYLCVDPRRRQGKELLKFVKPFLEERGFAGLSMYPSLGFSPDNEALSDLYEYAQTNQVSIVNHLDWQDHFQLGQEKYSSPETFSPVLKKFPNLKVCFTLLPTANTTNFASLVDGFRFRKPRHNKLPDWFYALQQMLEKYESVFVDISAVPDHSIGLYDFRNFRSRMLTGSDYSIGTKQKRKKIPFVPYEIKKPWTQNLERRDLKSSSLRGEKENAAPEVRFVSNTINTGADNERYQ
jgi:hypothetical protein